MSTLTRMAALAVAALMISGPALAAPLEANGKAMVRARALMTKQEITQYRRALKGAPTMEARQQIRAAKWAQLRRRAEQRGVLLAERNPRVPGMGWTESNGERVAAREGGMEGHAMRMMAPRAP
jgi:hypothetical protein